MRALKEEGYRVILVNANPATIMTDPQLADATYIEPVLWQEVASIIEKERPDALLPTMGGQTALNCALDLEREGVLAQFDVELIGATKEAILRAENREKFADLMHSIGLEMPRSAIAHSLEEAYQAQASLGFPVVIRPSFTMGGTGGGIAYNREEFEAICTAGLTHSPTKELLIDESVIGWKEFEMEVVRDKNDNGIIVCTIENFDPMGVHTGDSITVAPAQTLTDKEYQRMRDAAIQVLRAVGVETGGANVQFALNPENGRLLVIEMNPRVSRSSALASKATGFPIAKIATKLAIGYTLDELKNPMTMEKTPASFEPTLDYVVVKMPRFNFDKFPETPRLLTTQMKSVGEVMAIGANFSAALQKAIRSLEIDRTGLGPLLKTDTDLARCLREPTPDRLWYIADAFRFGWSVAQIHQESKIDPWFLGHIQQLVESEQHLSTLALITLPEGVLRQAKQQGFSDARLADLMAATEAEMRSQRHAKGILPVYKRIDSCAGEFPCDLAYLYSTYDEHDEASVDPKKPSVLILGGGPNRIGQGIEFDYCCVHAAIALRSMGIQAIMVNCNPETVSTDIDMSDRLYFEPVTLEDVLAIVALEKPMGVIVHYGGQTPLRLAHALAENGVPILGTSPESIDQAEDRGRFQALVQSLGLMQPENAYVVGVEAALQAAARLQYPLMVRPSYVLGGRAMEVVQDEGGVKGLFSTSGASHCKRAFVVGSLLSNAIEVDVDAVCDGCAVLIGAIMERLKKRRSFWDSACVLPPFSLGTVQQQELIDQVRRMALELGVVGLLNVQFAVQRDDIYVLEVNPRASRTVPFVSKAIGVSLAQIATRCMMGRSLAEQGVNFRGESSKFYSVKLPVFPFLKFPGVDCILGPEMKSTGEAMGIASFWASFCKSPIRGWRYIAKRNRVFISVRDTDKTKVGKWVV